MLPEFKAKTRVSVNLPAPSGYRETVPAFHTPDLSPDVGRVERSRLVLWFAVAVALHVALLLAIFLTPPLRLKASYGPDRWVHIMPIPSVAAAPASPPVSAAPVAAAAKPSPAKVGSRKANPAAEP